MKPELGTKRVCSKCGAKFYDLARDPVVCPKCGTSFPASAFLSRTGPRAAPAAAAVAPDEPELVVPAGAEVISLEDAEAEATAKTKGKPAEIEADAEDDVEIPASDEDDTFLEEEEEESGDVSDIIGEKVEDDDET